MLHYACCMILNLTVKSKNFHEINQPLAAVILLAQKARHKQLVRLLVYELIMKLSKSPKPVPYQTTSAAFLAVTLSLFYRCSTWHMLMDQMKIKRRCLAAKI